MDGVMCPDSPRGAGCGACRWRGDCELRGAVDISDCTRLSAASLAQPMLPCPELCTEITTLLQTFSF